MSMSQPAESPRDLNWIKQMLQTALELEFSTLPLYLSAMFSLEVQNYTAYNLVRSVVMEEMVHMAINANMLAALGGKPQIKTIQVQFPTHGLPGGAEPDLEIGLAQFSKNQLKNFMRIEMPRFLLRQKYQAETYPTIAVFYDSIRQAIQENANAVRSAVRDNAYVPPLSGEDKSARGGRSIQVGDDIGFTTIRYQPDVDPVEQLLAGIEEILEQGEGASAESLFAGPGSEQEESHYGRFAELYYGASYQEPKPQLKLNLDTEPEFFKGQPIPWPNVVNTLAVPMDGYACILDLHKKLENGANEGLPGSAGYVSKFLQLFDTTFSQNILACLDAVWNDPTVEWWPTLGSAVESMMKMRVFSCFYIMRCQIPPEIINQLQNLYSEAEFQWMSAYTDWTKPVFYGPRFLNTNGSV